ncbi:hypothetical protein GCM10009678_89990 [Actinomadura kijaniata]|uniref:Uncharacterized protein n=1 Tax=Actinomadura namibiensis TaxID=182080 RepID=A0A7W3QQU9_ACTNM|nr:MULTISPECIES: hypothetical protein [Actinomadura]MBA8955977.1 hypothetical protein [Actinomadura namibiensis]
MIQSQAPPVVVPGTGEPPARDSVRGWLRWIGYRVFAVHDAQARAMGLEVAESPTGLRRAYRDPRFHGLAVCVRDGTHVGEAGTVCGRCGARFFRETA